MQSNVREKYEAMIKELEKKLSEKEQSPNAVTEKK